MLGVILLTLVASALGAPTTPAGGSTSPDLIAAGTSSFNVLDKNKNGHVEVSEFLISFDKSDTNQDGIVTLPEFIRGYLKIMAIVAKNLSQGEGNLTSTAST